MKNNENENKLKDFYTEIEYKDKKYKLYFNLNVMEEIQNEYKTFDNWTDLVGGLDKKGNPRETDIKALIFGFQAMLNEGIDIQNEDEGTDIKFFTPKQVGRLITEIGLQEANQKLMDTVVESTKNTKNA